MHYFYINNSKTNEKLKEYGFVISNFQNEYVQHLKQDQGCSEADLIRKMVDFTFDKQVINELESLDIDDNVSYIRKNIKFSKNQLAQLEQIANDLNKNSSSLKISKAEVIRRLITLFDTK
ncbi:MAG: hypothetical protein JM58_17230 [Peptococcaceae bacterium BICA1-8]|nr:MAG: hypothetical protein JM58_17230 [Peptococcaceae bacterium BICA1-8]